MTTRKKLIAIASEIREFCETHSDQKLVEKYARFFTEGYDAYGISSDALIAKMNEIVEQYREILSLDDIVKLGDLLLKSGKYEETSFAILIAEAYQKKFTRESFQSFGNWLENGISNWAHTDILCSLILSVFLKNDLVKINDMQSWRSSDSKWKRRAVPVALITCLQMSQNIRPLLDFIDPMMPDADRFVHQGLGWFLREAWKKHPQLVEQFLLKWKNTAARKIYQYATEKMTKEEKEKFRKEKTN